MNIYRIYNNIPSFVPEFAKVDSFDKKNFEFLFEMEQHHFWHIGRKEIIHSMLEKIYSDRLSTIKMLEIGCGNGSVLQFLESKGINIEGGDLFLEALQFCRKRVHVPLYQLDALNIPFADEQYDVVGLFDVIEHIDNDNRVLEEAYRICKPGGRIILTVPANKRMWSYFDVISYHKRRYSKEELYQKLRNAGFVAEKISFFLFFLFPILFLYRKFRSSVSDDNMEINQEAEVNTIPLINSIFLGVLRIEKLLINITSLPFGTSLIAIVRKSNRDMI